MSTLTRSFAGRTVTFASTERGDTAVNGLADGSYETPLPLLLAACLVRTSGAFLDVGANTGLYSVLAGAVASDRKVFAFEPAPTLLPILNKNLELNGLFPRASVHEVALSDTTGSASLYFPDDAHGLVETSASLDPDFQPTAGSVEVRTSRLDDMAIPDTIGVVKVDIEGHEAAFLRGARRTIERDRPIMFIEVLSSSCAEQCDKAMTGMDYVPFRIRPDLAIISPCVRHDFFGWNQALIPFDKISVFRSACENHGIELVKPF